MNEQQFRVIYDKVEAAHVLSPDEASELLAAYEKTSRAALLALRSICDEDPAVLDRKYRHTWDPLYGIDFTISVGDAWTIQDAVEPWQVQALEEEG